MTPVFIVQARPDQLAQSTGPLEGVLVVPDAHSATHKALGLSNMPLGKMFSKSLWGARRRAEQAGHAQSWSKTLSKESDTMRNPGAAIVDQMGMLRWIHRGVSVEDLPTPSELLERARGVLF